MTQVPPFRRDPAHYPLKVRILARYADVDPLWHVNNVADARGPTRLPDKYRERLGQWLLEDRGGVA